MKNNFPELERRYENADELIKLEMDMINSIEHRVIIRGRHYIKDFRLKEKEK